MLVQGAAERVEIGFIHHHEPRGRRVWKLWSGSLQSGDSDPAVAPGLFAVANVTKGAVLLATNRRPKTSKAMKNRRLNYLQCCSIHFPSEYKYQSYRARIRIIIPKPTT